MGGREVREARILGFESRLDSRRLRSLRATLRGSNNKKLADLPSSYPPCEILGLSGGRPGRSCLARGYGVAYAAGVAEVLLFALSMALGILVPALIVRRDLKRLTGEHLARSWPDASLWLAIVVFGPVCVPIHFIRTRRSWAGLGLAALWL